MTLSGAEALQHFLWFGIFALGLEFMAIATRLRGEKTLPTLGGNILLLSLMVGLDVWINIPGMRDRSVPPALLEACQDLYQVFACGYVALSLWFVRGLTGRPSAGAAKTVTAVLTILSLALLADAASPARLFVYVDDWKWIITPLYYWVFAVPVVAAFAWVVWLAFAGWRRAQGQDRRSLGHLCVAYALLFVCGVLDLLTMWMQEAYLTTWVLYGTLGVGVIATFIFTDKLIYMYRSRRGSLLEIEEIRGTIEAQRPLGDLGRSAMKVSDEIQSYVSLLKADSQGLKDEIETKGGPPRESAGIRRIDEARRRLERYATGILEYSTCSRLGPLVIVAPASLLERCVRERFPGEAGRFAVVAAPGARVLADPARLERAVGELLANALESGSPWIEARVRCGLGLVSIAIEDAGCGVPEGLVETIAQPFFTTRKRQGQHGLGASIAAAILRAHGGSLRFLPKPRAGLIANLVLPAAGEIPARARDGAAEAAFISGDRLRIARFQELCANLGLRPLILPPGSGGRAEGRPLCVLADADAGLEPPAAWRQAPFRRLDGDGRFAAQPASGRSDRLLSEETMMEWLAPA